MNEDESGFFFNISSLTLWVWFLFLFSLYKNPIIFEGFVEMAKTNILTLTIVRITIIGAPLLSLISALYGIYLYVKKD